MITDDIFRTCHFPETAHGHGKDMFFTVWRCQEHPRLQIKDLSDRKARKTTRIYLVDGKEMADQAAALDALNIAVVLTPEETALLASIPDGWNATELGSRGDKVAELFGLTCKGQVIWQRGAYRRADDNS